MNDFRKRLSDSLLRTLDVFRYYNNNNINSIRFVRLNNSNMRNANNIMTGSTVSTSARASCETRWFLKSNRMKLIMSGKKERSRGEREKEKKSRIISGLLGGVS